LVDARWKARAEFLLSVIELPFLSLTVDALQGKMRQNSLHLGVGRSLGTKISGGSGRLWGTLFGFYKNRHIIIRNGRCHYRIEGVIAKCRGKDGKKEVQVAERRTYPPPFRFSGYAPSPLTGKLRTQKVPVVVLRQISY